MAVFSCLKVTVDDGVAHFQLNRPDKANALNGELWREIGQACEWADQTPEVRVVMLSGAGQYFCSGIDFELVGAILDEVSGLGAGHKEERMRQIILDLQASFNAIENCRKPVLAAIHGLCLGGGLDLVVACDLRYASAETRFALKEVDLGIIADVGSLQRLPHLIGEGQVRELAFTGREFTAAEAFQLGVVNRVFDTPEQLWTGVAEIARTIAAKSPLTVRGIKQVMNYSRDHSVASGLNFVATWNAAMLLSEDTQEAITAVMQKRRPQYKN